MKRMFLYLYGSIVALFLGVGFLSYWVLEYVNDQRYLKHLNSHMLPVAKLISSGLERQPQENREEWLALVRELMSVKVEVQGQACRLSSKISTIATNHKTYEVCFNRNINESIVFEMEALNEQLFSTMAFLVLNELGTVTAGKRQKIFNDIKSISPFAIYRSTKIQRSLSAKHRSLLGQGRIIVQWTKQFDKADHLIVLAPWGNTSDNLVLGPIPLFETYTKDQIYLIVCLALVLLASLVSLILKQLTRTIKNVHTEINSISRDKLGLAATPRQMDSINSIGETIDELVDRIKHLLHEKNYAIRAISHDLRTPISRMLFRVETLRGAEGDDVSDSLRRDLLHMESLIKQLLSYERLSSYKGVGTEPSDLKLVCDELLDAYKDMHGDVQFVLNAERYPPGLKIPMTRELIYRAIDNLLQNACRYAENRIAISFSMSLGSVRVSVTDDGPGIFEVDDAMELFEPFYKGDKSRGGGEVGFGFGLAIVKKIAEVHGGSVRAENMTPKGASFSIELPLGLEADVMVEPAFVVGGKDAPL